MTFSWIKVRENTSQYLKLNSLDPFQPEVSRYIFCLSIWFHMIGHFVPSRGCVLKSCRIFRRGVQQEKVCCLLTHSKTPFPVLATSLYLRNVTDVSTKDRLPITHLPCHDALMLPLEHQCFLPQFVSVRCFLTAMGMLHNLVYMFCPSVSQRKSCCGTIL